MIPTLLGVAVLVFVLLRVLPGDVVEMRFASGQNQFVDQKMLDAERAKLGLDKPIWQQFGVYLAGLVRLDFGRSMWTGSPITEEIKLRFALSLQLALMATVVATRARDPARDRRRPAPGHAGSTTSSASSRSPGWPCRRSGWASS